MKKEHDDIHPVLGEIKNDRYNNGVTYHKAWDTPENKKWNEILHKEYLERPYCSSDCPLAWSKEVYELLKSIDKKFGIQYNTSSIRGYSVRGNPVKWFITDPLKSVTIHHIEFIIGKNFTDDRKWIVRHWPKELSERLKSLPKRIFDSFVGLFGDYVRAIRNVKVVYINRYLNKLLNKQVQLSQVKEKYGSLTIYFSAPDYLDEYIEKQIKIVEVKLSLKGAYHSLSSFWNSYSGWATGTEYHPDVITTEKNENGTFYVKKTGYRGIIKDMVPKEEFDRLRSIEKPLDEEV